MDKMNSCRVDNTSSDLVKKCLSELAPRPYSSVDLIKFTSNFLKSNKIGSGGFGEVYKGQLPSGILVAVKVLEEMDIVKDTFMAEVCTMGKVIHHNLIKLHGYCFEDDMKALVFEYMENGSLDNILYENNRNDINWEKLYGIAIGTAKGLNYLHNDLDEQIIHYDIKAANVLLDKNFSAKIADFGLSKIMNKDVSRFDVSRIRGTPDYIAPEIWMPNLQVSCKCDVYSFGMMLFEILGKRSNGVEENWFPLKVWKQFENGTLDQLIRDCGITEKDKEKAIILSKVALWCAHHIPEQRPTMMEVVLMLKENSPVREPSYPFILLQISDSSMVSSQEGFPQVLLEVPLARSKRKWVASLERDPAYLSYASITGGGNNGPEDGGVTLSNVPKMRAPNILEENLATSIPNKGMKIPVTNLVGKTSLKYKDLVLQCIAKDEAVTIGVHGMGGAGKTTIVKHVHNHLVLEPNRFDKIIWVIVPKDGNIIKLQDDLAKELEFKLSRKDDKDRRSRLLLQALEKRKRFILFFDDMWTPISLDEIGIPEPTQENGCKLILTTRNLEVCRAMGCHEENTIKVEPLPEDEALEMFMMKVGRVLTPEVSKIAEMVAKKCSGLPLAITTVCATMKGSSDISNWRVALNDLNLKDPRNRTMDIEDNVYECLKFSYDRLENEKQRKCFLCCLLYPEGWPIVRRDLVDFWIMDGIVAGINRQDELDKGQYVLNMLKEHCLLETVDEIYDVEYDEYSDGVKIHDLIRDMALRLTSKSFMVKTSSILGELQNAEEWNIDLERASFMNSIITRLSITPICPKLSTLVVEGTFLKSVAHSFFVHMKHLKVLDMRCDRMFKRNYLKLLPDSISDLVNLRALRLSGCKKLKKLPSLAKLVLLRKLELNDTGIEELPEGMEMLVNLRCLNLHRVQLKEIIPGGFISKFSLLQELYLGGIDTNKLYEDESGESFAKELLSLKELEILNVGFRCWSDYVSYVGSSKFNGLKCFFLAIGLESNFTCQILGPSPQATIRFFGMSNEQFLMGPLFQQFLMGPLFPQNTKRVEISQTDDVKRLSELGWLIKDLRELVAFTIMFCDKIECIWSSKDENQEFSASGTSSSTCWIRSLETIEIFGCPTLYTIFEGIPISSSVLCLKKLTIWGCHNLKNVFPSSRLLQLLPNLEEIKINHCYELEEFIGDEEEETETPIAIHKLKDLKIWTLPKLKRIWRGVLICNSLTNVMVEDCFELKRLPQLMGEEQLTPPPALRYIEGSIEWWGSLEWDPAYPKNILEPFFVEVEEDMKCCESDESAPEGAGIDREVGGQIMHQILMSRASNRRENILFFLSSLFPKCFSNCFCSF